MPHFQAEEYFHELRQVILSLLETYINDVTPQESQPPAEAKAADDQLTVKSPDPGLYDYASSALTSAVNWSYWAASQAVDQGKSAVKSIFDRSKAHAEAAKALHTDISHIQFHSGSDHLNTLSHALNEISTYIDTNLATIQDDAAQSARITVTAGRYAQLLENLKRYTTLIQQQLKQNRDTNLQQLPQRFSHFIGFVIASLQAYIDSNQAQPATESRTVAAEAMASVEQTYSDNKPMFMGAAAASLLFLGAGTMGVTFAAGGFLAKGIAYFDQATVKQTKTQLAESLIANINKTITEQITDIKSDEDVYQQNRVLIALIKQTLTQIQLQCQYKNARPLEGRLGPMLNILRAMALHLHDQEHLSALQKRLNPEVAITQPPARQSLSLSPHEEEIITKLAAIALQNAVKQAPSPVDVAEDPRDWEFEMVLSPAEEAIAKEAAAILTVCKGCLADLVTEVEQRDTQSICADLLMDIFADIEFPAEQATAAALSQSVEADASGHLSGTDTVPTVSPGAISADDLSSGDELRRSPPPTERRASSKATVVTSAPAALSTMNLYVNRGAGQQAKPGKARPTGSRRRR